MNANRTIERDLNDAAHTREDKLRAHAYLLTSPTPLGAVYREQVKRVTALTQKIQEALK